MCKNVIAIQFDKGRNPKNGNNKKRSFYSSTLKFISLLGKIGGQFCLKIWRVIEQMSNIPVQMLDAVSFENVSMQTQFLIKLCSK